MQFTFCSAFCEPVEYLCPLPGSQCLLVCSVLSNLTASSLRGSPKGTGMAAQSNGRTQTAANPWVILKINDS